MRELIPYKAVKGNDNYYVLSAVGTDVTKAIVKLEDMSSKNAGLAAGTTDTLFLRGNFQYETYKATSLSGRHSRIIRPPMKP
jgi:hypothetical protein